MTYIYRSFMELKPGETFTVHQETKRKTFGRATVHQRSTQYGMMEMVYVPETLEVLGILTQTFDAFPQGQFCYRWVKPELLEQLKTEYQEAGEIYNERKGMKVIDLDVVEDILEKGEAILAGNSFDERVRLPLDLDDALLLELFKRAHELDITFNAYMRDVLLKAVELANLNQTLDTGK